MKILRKHLCYFKRCRQKTEVFGSVAWGLIASFKIWLLNEKEDGLGKKCLALNFWALAEDTCGLWIAIKRMGDRFLSQNYSVIVFSKNRIRLHQKGEFLIWGQCWCQWIIFLWENYKECSNISDRTIWFLNFLTI